MTDPKDAEIARLRKMLDDVREETVRLNKATDKQYAQTLEKLKTERDAALAQVAGDSYRLQKQHWFVETGWVDGGGIGHWVETKQSVEVATETEAKALQDQWLVEGKLQHMPWGEIRPTFTYGLFRIRSVWQDVSPSNALAARDRRDAQMRAEGRKEGLREAAEIADAKDPDKPTNYLHRRENIPAAILAAAEKEAQG